MRPHSSRFLRCKLITLVFVTGCSAAPDHVTGLRPALAALADVGGNPVIQSLTGHWEIIGSQGNLNKISVNAEKRLDGTVTGEVQFEQFTEDGLSILAHGTVLCLTVEGNKARLALAGEQTTDAGTRSGFAILTAIDNGEGNPNPDLATNLITVMVEEHALSHCNVPLVPDTRALPVQRGNLQVRD
jgi:hypothetical protein